MMDVATWRTLATVATLAATTFAAGPALASACGAIFCEPIECGNSDRLDQHTRTGCWIRSFSLFSSPGRT